MCFALSVMVALQQHIEKLFFGQSNESIHLMKGYEEMTTVSPKSPPSFKVATKQNAKTEMSCTLSDDRNRKKYR
jgi:hypothetical protein